jgi:hypothetical protein
LACEVGAVTPAGAPKKTAKTQKSPSSHTFTVTFFQLGTLAGRPPFESFPPFPLASSSKLTPIIPFTASHRPLQRLPLVGPSLEVFSSHATTPTPHHHSGPTNLPLLSFVSPRCRPSLGVIRHSLVCLRLPCVACPRPASSSSMGQAPGDAVACNASALRLGRYRLRLGSKRRCTMHIQITTATRHRFWRHDTECEAPSAPACCLSSAPRFVAVEPLVQRCFHDVV